MEEHVTIHKHTLILLLGVAVVIFGGFIIFSDQSKGLEYQNTSVEMGGPVQIIDGMQEVSIRALATGLYDKQEVVVKKGIPVKLTFTAEPNSGCGQILMMRQFGVQLLSRNGEAQTATFIPQEEGVYEYSCSMRMFVGTMRVVA